MAAYMLLHLDINHETNTEHDLAVVAGVEARWRAARALATDRGR